jgi:hypothetical protein
MMKVISEHHLAHGLNVPIRQAALVISPLSCISLTFPTAQSDWVDNPLVLPIQHGDFLLLPALDLLVLIPSG